MEMQTFVQTGVLESGVLSSIFNCMNMYTVIINNMEMHTLIPTGVLGSNVLNK